MGPLTVAQEAADPFCLIIAATQSLMWALPLRCAPAGALTGQSVAGSVGLPAGTEEIPPSAFCYQGLVELPS